MALVNKPAGITSHDVVFRVRGRLSNRAGHRVKTGHAGTLDPFATGLLVVLLGRATRLQQYLQHQPKTYRAVARLGWTSDSGDSDGVLTETGRIPADPQLPTGSLQLAVPAYSAIQIDGERLYARARRGEQFDPPVREMTVYRADRMDFDGTRATFEIDCAGGTYVRSVVATLEDAYCEQLQRTRVGELRLEDAVDLDAVELDSLLNPLTILSHLPLRELDAESATTLIHGRSLDAIGAPDGEAIRLVVEDRLLGVGRVHGDVLKPESILAPSLDELLAR